MRKFLYLFIFSCAVSAGAQEISISTTQSDVFKDDKKHTGLLFSESDGQGGFVTVRSYFGGLLRSLKGYYVEHYDKNLKLLNETEIEVDNNRIKGLMVDNGKIFLLESVLDKKADTFSYNVWETSFGSFDFQKKSLFSFDENDIKKYFGFVFGIFAWDNGSSQWDSSSSGEVTFSKNKNFFCVNFDIKDKDNQTQRLFVYDKSFNLVFQKEFLRDVKDRQFDYENIDVDDANGNLFLLGKVYENNSIQTKKKGKANYHFELYKITPTDQISTSFQTEENFVGSLFTVYGDKALSCAGFYSERNDHRYKGVCRFNLDPETLAITNTVYSPFSEKFMKDKYGKVKDKELRNLKLRKAILTENEDLVLNAEEYYITVQQNMAPGAGMTTTTVYHFDDIVSVKMDKDGKLLWARNINKRQASAGISLEYLSFSSTAVGDDTYIYINCSDKIRKISNDRLEFKQGGTKNLNLYAIKINSVGEYSFQSVVDNEDTEVPYFVKEGIITDAAGKNMVFIGRRKSKKQFLKTIIN
ncbi:hypothetical protein [Aequorivita echinoideorum]|uniref:Uncharacterized protein n=1 Tax=Aequorivita echinoideorum TaxID=1549647 RepID=A0ABS5S4C8_9FLAO|nr:hypothetical protein [Aequorivita echinoideorum]MBT0607260.1 hypothetical protein [Aequorivita echinoideorum]